MSSESMGEERTSSQIGSDGPADNFLASSQGRRTSALDGVGKSAKTNQKGEELPWYEVSNIIYRPGGEFCCFGFI